jgi:hypothetical protein
MPIKISVLALLVFCYSCAAQKSSPSIDCDKVNFSSDNIKNDTNKIIFINAVVFDTSACMMHGYLIDRNSFLPISNASIFLKGKANEFKAKTNGSGEFEIFENDLCNKEVWELNITHPDYVCSRINYSQLNGGVYFKVKLLKK